MLSASSILLHLFKQYLQKILEASQQKIVDTRSRASYAEGKIGDTHEGTMTILQFFKNGRPVKRGLEVSVHWEGYNSWNPLGGGHSKYRTDDNGCVFIEDDRIAGHERKTDNIYIENPEGGYSLKYPNYVVTKGVKHQLHLEQANHQ